MSYHTTAMTDFTPVNTGRISGEIVDQIKSAIRVGARGGAFVTTPAPSLVSEGFADMLRMSDVSPADVTEMRLVFELAMLPLAVERATAEDLEELEAICDASEAAGYDVARS